MEMEQPLLTIEVISDAICPWCWIGKRQIERAKALLDGKLTVAVRWKPFELNPGMPKEGVPRRVYRQAKFGSLDYSDKLDARVAAAGAAVGLDYHFDRVGWTPNTFDAHRLIWIAGQKGLQDAVVEGLFAAYFRDGRNIGETAVLIEVAQAAGIDPGKAGKLLASGTGAAEVREELERAHDIGVDSVPSITVGGEPLISGAAPADQLAATLLKASSLQRV
jgi:predicted DsbA family dithiol-disulfide isomerase